MRKKSNLSVIVIVQTRLHIMCRVKRFVTEIEWVEWRFFSGKGMSIVVLLGKQSGKIKTSCRAYFPSCLTLYNVILSSITPSQLSFLSPPPPTLTAAYSESKEKWEEARNIPLLLSHIVTPESVWTYCMIYCTISVESIHDNFKNYTCTILTS